MRQASWNEMFATRHEPLSLRTDVPAAPAGWRRLFWWEDLISFVLLGVIALAVVDSVHRADWVGGMPSLLPVTFFGLLLGALLARVRWPEALIHVIALPLGAAAALATILSILPGATPWDRYDDLHARMAEWFHIAFTGGISNDDLPFIVLVVPLAWLGAYLSSWAVFRWQNAWLALIPTGFLLLSNLSYLPDQFSFSVLVFLFAGVLLVTRVHATARSQAWREDATPYPPLLSLSVLHATFWVALVLMAAAWVMPQAGKAGPLASAWQRATAPLSDRAEGLSRLFISVRGPSDARIHRFDDLLPFQGAIELPETLVLDVTTEPLDQRRYLRAQSFDVYTSTGWQEGSRRDIELDADEITRVDDELSARTAVSVWITSEGQTDDIVFTIGQPRRVDKETVAKWLSGPENVTRLRLLEDPGKGSTVQTAGSLSVATVEELRAACYNAAPANTGIIHFRRSGVGPPAPCEDLPAVIQTAYLRLPSTGMGDVRRLAWELTAGDTNAYDAAVSIEAYLREFPIDYDIPQTPRDRDTVDYFLFDLQRGYFDYHASAMVVMLRSIGIPARLAVGYVLRPEERDPDANRYRVSEQSAFAWPEVYFPGYGWIEFNPTPSQPPIERYEPQAATTAEGDGGENIPGTLGLEDLPGTFGDDGSADALALQTDGSGNRNLWVLAGVAGGMAGLMLAASAWGRHLWVRGLAGAPQAVRRWEQTVRLASWTGAPPHPAQTPHEYARALRDRYAELDDVDLLADAYVRERFGREPSGPSESRLNDAWQTVRAALLRRLLRLRRVDDRPNRF